MQQSAPHNRQVLQEPEPLPERSQLEMKLLLFDLWFCRVRISGPRRVLRRRAFRLACALCCAIAMTVLAGCRPAGMATSHPATYPLRVVCTTGYVADLARKVGGPHVSVETLMGPGVDPHLYKARLSDKWKLNAADVVFYNGLHLEGRLGGLLEKRAERMPVFAVTEDLLQRQPHRLRSLHGGRGYDPHVWFDVMLWAQCARCVARRLAEVDPARAEQYRAGAEAYIEQLARLDAWVRRQLENIPPEQRVLVTAHDAFGYFGRAYDVEVRSLQGLSTADEAALENVNQLVDMLVRRKVGAVFIESSVPAKNIRALVEGCAARGHRVEIGGELYSDALGPPGTSEETYVGTVRYNVTTIVTALSRAVSSR